MRETLYYDIAGIGKRRGCGQSVRLTTSAAPKASLLRSDPIEELEIAFAKQRRIELRAKTGQDCRRTPRTLFRVTKQPLGYLHVFHFVARDEFGHSHKLCTGIAVSVSRF